MTKHTDNLNDLFNNAMTEVPASLKNQLENIPKTQNVWDWTVILQIIFLTPFVIWSLLQLSPLVLKTISSISKLPIPSYGEATISNSLPINFAIVVLVGLITVIYFALKDEAVWR
ncbi:MAG: hypothetical protein H8D23_01495 [Candidatus Brocadiales bacterium]|nr:hypothetical protein [Candidatus Brocadiales bacterium]